MKFDGPRAKKKKGRIVEIAIVEFIRNLVIDEKINCGLQEGKVRKVAMKTFAIL